MSLAAAEVLAYTLILVILAAILVSVWGDHGE